MVKILFLDIDGTITREDGSLPFESIEGIHKLKNKNFKIVLASSNSYCVIRTLKRYFKIADHIIAESGGVLDYGKEILKIGNKKVVIKAAEKIKENFPYLIEHWTNPMRLTDQAFFRPKDEKLIIKIKNFIENEELKVKIIDTKFSLELVEKNINKALTAKKLLNLLNLKNENTFAIGDSESDFEMLKFVNFPLALENSNKELKKIAKYVAKNSYYRGFLDCVKFLEKKFLINK